MQFIQIQRDFPTLPSDEHNRRCADARVGHRIIPSNLFFSLSGLPSSASRHMMADADLFFVYFLAVAPEEGRDSRSSECEAERIEHGCELEIGEGMHVVGNQTSPAQFMASEAWKSRRAGRSVLCRRLRQGRIGLQ
jgi:hypothetical protein